MCTHTLIITKNGHATRNVEVRKVFFHNRGGIHLNFSATKALHAQRKGINKTVAGSKSKRSICHPHWFGTSQSQMLFQAVASKIHVSCSHGILSFFGSTQWGKHGKTWRNHCHSNRFIGIRYMSLIWFKPKYNWVVNGCCLNSTGHSRPMQKWIKFTYARTPMNGWQNSKWNQIISNKYQIYIMHEYAWRQEDCGLKQQVAVKRK